MENAEKLMEAYKRLAMEKGTLPVSRKEIAQAADLDIEEFAKSFANLEALQSAVWVDYLKQTLGRLEESEEFVQYSVREKMLAFYFTFFEILDGESEFVQHFAPKLGIWNYNPSFLLSFKDRYLAFVKALVEQGTETGEIAERMVLGGEYAGWHWPQMLFLLNKWVDDPTEAKVKSDQAIEKAVNLGFDIMERNVFDSAFDFAKFMITGS